MALTNAERRARFAARHPDRIKMQASSRPKSGQYLIGRKAYMKQYRAANKIRLREQGKQWRKNNKDAARMHVLTNKYRISRAKYFQLIGIRNCEICGGPPVAGDKCLSMDHCHDTGKVRGMLCRNCNSALGLAKENPELLIKMAEYLATRRNIA